MVILATDEENNSDLRKFAIDFFSSRRQYIVTDNETTLSRASVAPDKSGLMSVPHAMAPFQWKTVTFHIARIGELLNCNDALIRALEELSLAVSETTLPVHLASIAGRKSPLEWKFPWRAVLFFRYCRIAQSFLEENAHCRNKHVQGTPSLFPYIALLIPKPTKRLTCFSNIRVSATTIAPSPRRFCRLLGRPILLPSSRTSASRLCLFRFHWVFFVLGKDHKVCLPWSFWSESQPA